MDALELVRRANARYYEAFEAQDVELMSAVWEDSERTICTHPGWPTLHGSDVILESYAAIFGGPQSLQVILTNEHVMLEGTLAYVTVDENLVDQDAHAAATTALNLFARRQNEEGLVTWRMIGHHGSPIMTSPR